MVIVESPIFTKIIPTILDDEGYRSMQNALVENPALGVVIPHSGGLRKIRWGAEGRGKRGGIRVIYYWWTGKEQIYLLYAYQKNTQTDLTQNQIRQLGKLVEQELDHE
jgi:mRNA-degrading endonuclease RelE of RelBE toxin-antitoxin system